MRCTGWLCGRVQDAVPPPQARQRVALLQSGAAVRLWGDPARFMTVPKVLERN